MPLTSVGTWIGAYAWLPLSRPVLSFVVRSPPKPSYSASEPPSQPAFAVPRTEAAMPQMLIGTWIGATSWLPETAPTWSDVWTSGP